MGRAINPTPVLIIRWRFSGGGIVFARVRDGGVRLGEGVLLWVTLVAVAVISFCILPRFFMSGLGTGLLTGAAGALMMTSIVEGLSCTFFTRAIFC